MFFYLIIEVLLRALETVWIAWMDASMLGWELEIQL
jgi:hypothetical protein